MSEMGWSLRRRWNHFRRQLSKLYPRQLQKPPPDCAEKDEATRLQEEMILKTLQLSDLDVLSTLGVGAYGRVYLVQVKERPLHTFALKKMAKVSIVKAQQQAHILSEKVIMSSIDSDFIVRLHKTFKDDKYLYMLLDVCLGGELWTKLRDSYCFDHPTSRFYSACVLEAFSYLHERDIMYRDLKPENILLDSKGYAKLVDFGFAKEFDPEGRTWTVCGTTEYMAPEVVLNKPHDTAVDMWALGILIYEMLVGEPPFNCTNTLKAYNLIVQGFQMWKFPPKLVRQDRDLIKKLCRVNPQERLGYGKGKIIQVYNHKFFEGFQFEALRSRALKPPLKPKVKTPTDVSNFDRYPDAPEEVKEDTSGWDENF
eukprot:GHVU01071946.1.p1 GENE.GHVU01071946.1~~GHVU01071946.1.p1  ORF type:complete len:368 (+),score=52.38 GHVU01071946.1:106-1209(+)